MRIKTKLLIAVVAALLMAVGLGLGAFLAQSKVDSTVKRHELTDRVVEATFELQLLRVEYLTNHEARSLEQWRKVYQTMTEPLAQMKARSADEVSALARMRRNNRDILVLFEQLVADYEGRPPGQAVNPTALAKETRVASDLALESGSLVTDAVSFSGAAYRDLESAERFAAWFSMGAMAIMLFIIAGISLAVIRSVINPVSELQKGAEAVAGGDLDYRVDIRSDDEVGQLTEVFNEMTAMLNLSFVALKKEISERRRAERELEAHVAELETFSYSVSHDLRTPIRSIDGFSKALLEEYSGQIDEKGRHYLERVLVGSQTMVQLIDDMLELSRVTRSRMRLEKVDLSALARDIADELKAQSDSGVEFEIEEGLEVTGDPALLHMAMENLLGNAWKFTAHTSNGRIEFGRTIVDAEPAFFVRDNGVGFDMAYTDKLFAPFQRLHNSSEFAGSGIGLATVQRIIRRHGGSIWAEGKEGQGAVFFFRL